MIFSTAAVVSTGAAMVSITTSMVSVNTAMVSTTAAAAKDYGHASMDSTQPPPWRHGLDHCHHGLQFFHSPMSVFL
jgi:hypothetical protein